MKQTLLYALSLVLTGTLQSQSSNERVGINTVDPQHPVHIQQVEGTELEDLQPVLQVDYTGSNLGQVMAISGNSVPADGAGIGGYFRGGFMGVYGRIISDGNFSYNAVAGHSTATGSGSNAAVRGYSEGTGTKYGVLGDAVGDGVNYGLYGNAEGGSTNWAGFFHEGDVFIQNRLGIGNYEPYRSLDIAGALAIARLTSESADEGAMLELRNTTPNPSILGTIRFLGIEDEPGQIQYTNDHQLTFDVNHAERMRINGAGQVGIGTSAPAATLDVDGRIRIGEDNTTPVVGMVRWNEELQDFEGFTGTTWRSFTKSSSAWGNIPTHFGTEDQTITANDGSLDDRFGSSVALTGDYAVVGATHEDIGANNNQGAAYIFHRTGSTWTQQTKIIANDGAPSDQFGGAVAISGDYVVVGAHQDDIGANSNQGSVYVFHRSGTTWTQQAKLTASDGGAEDKFGSAVAISGDYIIVGVGAHDLGSSVDQGTAYIFHRTGTTWTQQVKLIANDGAPYDFFGSSVAMDGNYVAIAANGDDVGANSNQGSVYIFLRNGTLWPQQAKLTANDGALNDFFGSSVAMTDEYLIAGATGDNSSAGSAYIFYRTGSSWAQQAKLVQPESSPNDWFGTSVGISGEHVIIGANGVDVGSNSAQGSAYIFKRTGTLWPHQVTLAGSDNSNNSYFGIGVGIAGVYGLVGANFQTVGGAAGQGAAYFFKRK